MSNGYEVGNDYAGITIARSRKKEGIARAMYEKMRKAVGDMPEWADLSKEVKTTFRDMANIAMLRMEHPSNYKDEEFEPRYWEN